ncbi:Heat shock transcription factor, partial [Cryomyces antarcticus]
KAKNTTSNSKRKREDDKVKQGTDSDEDVKRLSVDAGGEERKPQQGVRAGGLNQDLTTIPKSELASLHQEMQALQRQQKTIHKIITQMREQNNQLYQQATAFQTLHDRHENSINAILTFLATFYNRSLDGRHGQNLANMFGGAMPPTSQQQGSVVDVGDYTDTTSTPSNQLHRFSKRPLALLPAPASSTQYLQPGRVTTAPPSVRSSVSPPAVDVNPADGSSTQQQAANRDGGNTQGSNLHGSSAPSPVVKTDAETPNLLNQVPENDEIMSLINDVNATHSSGVDRQGLDFSSALDHYQNSDGNYPLTQQQRNEMLTLMANSSNGGAAQSNNALVSPDPPPMPSLEQYNQTQEQLDMLQRLQMEQDAKVQQLADRLQPLSPTGAIPGLTDGQYYHGDQDLT